MDSESPRALVEDFQRTFERIRRELSRVIVGHQAVIEQILTAFFAGGHVLIEGVPGTGKTLMVRTLAQVLNLSFNRIQFTVDLMPGDITGSRMVVETDGRRDFEFFKGPIFAHVLLADEINRSTPKTQSALLEAMAELQVTVAGTTYLLPPPFFVLATLNPIEMEGTYPLPEAQLDRFFFKVLLSFPDSAEMQRIIGSTTTAEVVEVDPVFDAATAARRVAALRTLAREVLVAPHLEEYAATLVRATIPSDSKFVPPGTPKIAPEEAIDRYVAFGSSPRGGQALLLGAKVRALLAGRVNVTYDDIDQVAVPALNHRLVLNFAAHADAIDPVPWSNESSMPPSGFSADLSSALRNAADPLFLRKLRRFRLAARHRLGHKPGNTLTPFGSQPSGLEIANHKPYSPGDDLRHFDWNAYGRLDQMMVKTYRAERESPLHLLIDTSASMGTPASDHKLPFAAAVAASLAYICLRQNDPVQIFCLGRDVGSWASPSFRHPQRLPDLQSFLAGVEAKGPTTLHQGIDLFLRTTHRPGLVVLLSDFLMPRSLYEEGLERLCARKYGVAALRVIGGNERNPDALPRRIRLHDAETGKERVVDLTDAHRATYRNAVQSHLASIKEWCESRSITFAAIDTDRGIEPCLLDTLPRVGLLQ